MRFSFFFWKKKRLCKPEDLTNVAAEFYGISLLQNWQTEPWKFSQLESPPGGLLRTEVHVFSDYVLCVGNNSDIANEALVTTFVNKYDITGQPVQLTVARILKQIMRFQKRIKIHVDVQQYWMLENNEPICLANATMITQSAKQFK